jgi:hypothetical protein
MSQRFIARLSAAVVLGLSVGACAGGGAIQPDRSVFSLDGNYQRCQFGYSIEDTFDRTVRVFKEAGYSLDVADRATGQISGERGNTGIRARSTDKGLKFYALVLPTANGQSQVGVKVVQIIEHGSLVNRSNTEIILTDPQMYQYMFRRIADIGELTPANGLTNGPAPAQNPAQPAPAKPSAWDTYGAQSSQGRGYGSN